MSTWFDRPDGFFLKLSCSQGLFRFGTINGSIPDAAKLQVHNIVPSNKVISKVSFPRGLDKTNTKIIVNLQLFGQTINLEN